MQEVFIVRHGDSYERFIVGVGASVEEAVRLADEHAASPEGQRASSDCFYGYLRVPFGRAFDWEGLEQPIVDEER